MDEMIELIVLEAEEKMQKSVEAFKRELSYIRTGRANPNMLDRVMVKYYGEPTPLRQIAGISVVEGRQLLIKPYDKSSIKDIDRGIYEADLGLTPQNDGNVVRINVPPLTEERRRELVKQVKREAEAGKVSLRNIRRHANADLEKADIDEDNLKDLKKEVQKMIDNYIKKIDQIAKDKENDLMTV